MGLSIQEGLQEYVGMLDLTPVMHLRLDLRPLAELKNRRERVSQR